MSTISDLLATYGFYVQGLSETKKNQWQIVYYAIASQVGLWAASTKGFSLFLVVIIMSLIAGGSVYVLFKLEDTLEKYRDKQQKVIEKAEQIAANEGVSLDPAFEILKEKKADKYGFWFRVLGAIPLISWLVLTTLAYSTSTK